MLILKKPLLYFSIILYIIGKTLNLLDLELDVAFIIISHFLVLLFLIECVLNLKKDYLIYSIIILMEAISKTGFLFEKMHWPLGFLSIIGLITPLLISFLLIYNYLKIDKDNNSILRFLIGIFILVQYLIFSVFVFSFNLSDQDIWILQIINYPIVIIATTLLLKDKTKNIGEACILATIIINGLFVIIKHFFETLILYI